MCFIIKHSLLCFIHRDNLGANPEYLVLAINYYHYKIFGLCLYNAFIIRRENVICIGVLVLQNRVVYNGTSPWMMFIYSMEAITESLDFPIAPFSLQCSFASPEDLTMSFRKNSSIE